MGGAIRRGGFAATATAVMAMIAASPTAPAGSERGGADERAGTAERYPWAKRIAAARRYAANRTGTISFAVSDHNGRIRGDHEYRRHYSASVVKVMLMVAYLRQGDVRHRDLRESDRDLLEPMIRRSDNETATRIRDEVGNDALHRIARDAGMRDFHTHAIWGLTQITPRDQARFMSRIETTIPERHETYAKRLLTQIVARQRWGIAPERPRAWKLHFKGGWSREYSSARERARSLERSRSLDGSRWRVNQVALMRNPPNRIGLAVLTAHNPSFDYGKQTIRGIADRLLRHINRHTLD